MNLEKIKDYFKEINEIFFVEENQITFLKVEVELKNIDSVTKISREISDFIDKNDSSDKSFILEVYSSGTDKIININEAKEYIGKNVFIKVKEEIKNQKEFKGIIISFENNILTIEWNQKGNIRKIEISKNNIIEIKLFAKTKRGEK